MRVTRARHQPPSTEESEPAAVATNGHAPVATVDRAVPAPVVEPGGQRLGELLVSRQAVDADALRAALMRQSADGGARLGQLLVDMGAIDEHTLTLVLSEQLGIPLVDLRETAADPAALALLAEPIARAHLAVPISIDGDRVAVAVTDPTDELRQVLHDAIGRPVELLLVTPTDVRHLLDRAYRVLGGVDRFVKAFELDDQQRAPTKGDEGGALSDEAPVVQVVNLLLTQALRDRASDVHIEPQEGRVRVRFRIDGALHDALELPASMGPALTSRLKIMATLNIVERRRPQDGQFSLEVDGRTVDMRLSVLATIWGEKCVHPPARHQPLRAAPARAGHALGDLRHLLATAPLAVRHGAVRRTDRQRQDDNPLRLAAASSTRPTATSSRSRIPSSTCSTAINQIRRERAGRRHRSPRASSRSSARTPT